MFLTFRPGNNLTHPSSCSTAIIKSLILSPRPSHTPLIVERLGWCRQLSSNEIYRRLLPARNASSSWESPARRLSRRSTVAKELRRRSSLSFFIVRQTDNLIIATMKYSVNSEVYCDFLEATLCARSPSSLPKAVLAGRQQS